MSTTAQGVNDSSAVGIITLTVAGVISCFCILAGCCGYVMHRAYLRANRVAPPPASDPKEVISPYVKDDPEERAILEAQEIYCKRNSRIKLHPVSTQDPPSDIRSYQESPPPMFIKGFTSVVEYDSKKNRERLKRIHTQQISENEEKFSAFNQFIKEESLRKSSQSKSAKS